MMSPGFSVWMSSFCGPAICSACLTTRCTSCSDMSCVRAGATGGGGACAAGGGSGRGGGTGAGGGAGWPDECACVAPSERCAGVDGDETDGERFCVDDRRVPLTEKRESRSV